MPSLRRSWDSGQHWAATEQPPAASWWTSGVALSGQQTMSAAFSRAWGGAGRRNLDQQTRLGNAGAMTFCFGSANDHGRHEQRGNGAPHCSWPSVLFAPQRQNVSAPVASICVCPSSFDAQGLPRRAKFAPKVKTLLRCAITRPPDRLSTLSRGYDEAREHCRPAELESSNKSLMD